MNPRPLQWSTSSPGTVASRVSSLDHEPFDNPVKREPIVHASVHIVQELRDRAWRRIAIQLKRDDTHRRIELDVMKA